MNLRATLVTTSLLLTTSLFTATVSAQSDWPVPANKATKNNPIPMTPKSITAGQSIYSSDCKGCHGGDFEDFAPTTTNAASLSTLASLDDTDGTLFWKIRRGKKNMPSFKRAMSKRDTWNVINYIRNTAQH